jgi:iron(III) transport system substrate-binding protein
MDPIVMRPQAVGIARNAPHPHAALLFADFMLSPEGQGILEARGRAPVSSKIKSEFNTYKFSMIDPAIMVDEGEKWQRIWEGLMMPK